MTLRMAREATGVEPASWQLLPLRFHRFDPDSILLTNLVGEHVFLSEEQFLRVLDGTCTDQGILAQLRAKHLIQLPDEQLPSELLAIKLRTRLRRLRDSTGRHMFVVTLRCEHTCRYCQVSRQSSAKSDYDMSQDTARRALDLAFHSPSPHLKLEFQGGEPLLNFSLVQWIVAEAKRLNEVHKKKLAFVIATNLALLDDSIIEFCGQEDVYLSTSLDGPENLHNGNRPRPGQDSWERTVSGIRKIQQTLGYDRVSALMTTTEASLELPHDIIDTYADLGLRHVFLRPISPYGFALRRRSGAGYDVQRWLEFYEDGLDHIINLNRRGVPMVETYTAIIAKKMFTNDDPGYVDLTSPAGIGLGALTYNYDGDVYASDEGRMLAEMDDRTFRLGNVHRSTYQDIMLSDQLLQPLEQSLTLSAPMCSTCAFEPYCGADPVFHHTTMGNFVGQKAMSAFCQRNMGVFTAVLRRACEDTFARNLFLRWAHQ
jgi:His-Xaa-Ser system radical SAM maturase HxsB